MKQKADVVVIGGGVIGLCAAYYLRKHGAEVVVIEKTDVGHGSSLHNAGLINPSHFVPLAAPGIVGQGLKWLLDPESPFYIKPRMDTRLLTWLWKFHRSCTHAHVRQSMSLLRNLHMNSLALFEEMSREFSFPFERRGMLLLFNSRGGEHACREEMDLGRSLGVKSELHDRTGLEKAVPGTTFTASGGVFYPEDAHLTPASFIQALHQHLLKLGVDVLTGVAMRSFVRTNGRITSIKTDKGELEGEQFVVAGGSWTPLIVEELGIRLPLQAGKGYSITVTPPQQASRIPFILAEARVAVTPMGQTLRFAGTMELAGIDSTINERRVGALLKSIPKYIANLHPAEMPRELTWSGLRPLSPDGLPYIGRFERCSNLIAATGHAMIGLSTGPITGKLVAELISGPATSLPIHALRPDRF